jgi:phosphate:Na+ symporter
LNLLNIAGGIALMLFAIRFLRKGLERTFGHRLHAWIEQMSQRTWTAAVAGLAFGAVAPSSTAQTLLTMQLLNSGKLPAERMLVFLLGANAGITVTVQLIAFRLFDYYPLLLLTGAAGYLGLRSETFRGLGQSLLALGFVFMGMLLISTTAARMMLDSDFQTIAGVLANHRWLLLFFGAALTFATQSSTATIGLVIAFAGAGACSMTTVLPVVLGANLGLGLTSLVAGWPTLAGRRLATANLVLKCAVLLPAMVFFGQVLGGIESLQGGIARQAANTHTGFNLVVALAGAALAGTVGRLVIKAVQETPRPGGGLSSLATNLDPAALSSPVFALANAARETIHLTEEVKTMLAGVWRAYGERNRALAQQVHEHDDRVDDLHAAIKHYLSRIPAEDMTPRDSQLQFGLLHFASQLESIADVIDKSIVHQVNKHIDRPYPVHPEDLAALAEMERRVVRRFDLALLLLTTRDTATAKQFHQEGEELKDWCIEVQRQHYQRLAGGEQRDQEASTHFLDLLNALRRISGQLNTIGHTFLPQEPVDQPG